MRIHLRHWLILLLSLLLGVLALLSMTGCARQQPAADAVAGVDAMVGLVDDSAAEPAVKRKVGIIGAGVKRNIGSAVSTTLENLPPAGMSVPEIQERPDEYTRLASKAYEEATSPWWGLLPLATKIVGGFVLAILAAKAPGLASLLAPLLTPTPVKQRLAQTETALGDAVQLGEDLKPLAERGDPQATRDALSKARVWQVATGSRDQINALRAAGGGIR